VSLGHTSKFQLVSRLGSITERHSSSGRQPNFVALNRGRHLYSAAAITLGTGHILVVFILMSYYGNYLVLGMAVTLVICLLEF